MLSVALLLTRIKRPCKSNLAKFHEKEVSMPFSLILTVERIAFCVVYFWADLRVHAKNKCTNLI